MPIQFQSTSGENAQVSRYQQKLRGQVAQAGQEIAGGLEYGLKLLVQKNPPRSGQIVKGDAEAAPAETPPQPATAQALAQTGPLASNGTAGGHVNVLQKVGVDDGVPGK
jgi:hypothetical protein